MDLAPKLVIYDNSCKLHAFCLNRNPTRYRDTRFGIDRFHFPNHVNCSLGYKLQNPQEKFINSQVVEQLNSQLKNLRSQLSYMTFENFMLHAALFMRTYNINKKKKW